MSFPSCWDLMYLNGTLHLFNLATTKTVVDRHSSSSMYPWWLIKSSRRGGGSKSAKFGCQKIPLWMEADKKIENHNDKTFKLERKHYGRYTGISFFSFLLSLEIDRLFFFF